MEKIFFRLKSEYDGAELAAKMVYHCDIYKTKKYKVHEDMSLNYLMYRESCCQLLLLLKIVKAIFNSAKDIKLNKIVAFVIKSFLNFSDIPELFYYIIQEISIFS